VALRSLVRASRSCKLDNQFAQSLVANQQADQAFKVAINSSLPLYESPAFVAFRQQQEDIHAGDEKRPSNSVHSVPLGKARTHCKHRGSRRPQVIPNLTEQYAVPPPDDEHPEGEKDSRAKYCERLQGRFRATPIFGGEMSGKRKKLPESAEDKAIVTKLETVLIALKKQTQAKKKVYFRYKGIVTDMREVPDHATQLRAAEELMKIMGLYL
jgi:hypothetical protein